MVTRFRDNHPKSYPQQRVTQLINGRCDETGKFSYASRGDARRAFRDMPHQPGQHRNREYLCACGEWHLTSQTDQQPFGLRDDQADDPWAKLTLQQAKGAHYALRVMRTVPATPMERVDEAITALARVIVNAKRSEQRRSA